MGLFRVFLALAAIYLLYRIVKGLSHLGKARAKMPVGPECRKEDMVEDPCCHVYIPLSEAYCGTLNGSDCYFCSRECYEKFKKERGMG